MAAIFGWASDKFNQLAVEFEFNLWFNRFMSTQNSSPLERAITATDGVANLAKACGVSAQAVYKWLEKGRPPVSRCEAVERASGGKVSRFDLLPPEFSTGRPKRKPSSLQNPK